MRRYTIDLRGRHVLRDDANGHLARYDEALDALEELTTFYEHALRVRYEEGRLAELTSRRPRSDWLEGVTSAVRDQVARLQASAPEDPRTRLSLETHRNA